MLWHKTRVATAYDMVHDVALPRIQYHDRKSLCIMGHDLRAVSIIASHHI